MASYMVPEVALFSSFLMVTIVIRSVDPNPTPVGRWMQPCDGRTVIRQPLLVTPSPEPESDDVVAQKLLIQSQEIAQLANVIRNNYFTQCIQSSQFRTNLDDSSPLTGFPTVSIFPVLTTFVERLKEDFRRASTAAVFLEVIRSDEELSAGHRFASEFRTLESKLYPFLCQIQNALQDRVSFNVPFVTQTVMADSDRNTNSTTQRHNRDYRVLKDTVRLFEAIAYGYGSIRTGR